MTQFNDRDGTVNVNDSRVAAPVTGTNNGTIINNTYTTPPATDSVAVALEALAALPLDAVPSPRADLPQTSRIPFESSPHFVGREAELKALARAIGQPQPTVVVPAVTTGLGGIGKTSLVTEFAYRYGIYFQGGVFWIDCSIADQVANQIAACALALQMNPTGLSLDEQVQRVMVAWQSPMPRLLIFDNCEDRTILDRWKPKFGGCRMLVTSRSDQWPTLTQIRLGLLEPHESRALLQTLCSRLTDQEADQIATDLGHLPLALHLAGSYLHSYPHQSVIQYRDDLTIAHRSLKGRGALPSPTQHELDVEATFMVSMKQLDPNMSIDSLALTMLDGAAWCAPSVPLPRDLILSFVPDGTDDDDAVDALRRLQALGLLEGIETVVLHRLLAQVVQTRMGWPETMIEVESRLHTIVARVQEQWNLRDMLPLEPHLRHLVMRSIHRHDDRIAGLVMCLGVFEQRQGRYGEAYRLFEQALTIRETVLGIWHPDTATSINNLAETLYYQGRYSEAQVLFEQSLTVRESILGSDHSDTTMSLHNLAVGLNQQGRYSEAQALYERVLAVREVILGLAHPDTALSINNLAMVLERQGRYAEAQVLSERALAIQESILGENNPNTALNISNLAIVVERQGRYAEAQGLYERALAIQESVLGMDHPDTATTMNNLAGVFSRQGQYEKAQVLYERALTINEWMLGENHPTTALLVNNLGGMFEHQGHYEKALPLFERALAVQESVLGDHLDTAKTMNNLASVLWEQGRYEETQILYERALKINESVLGSDHPDTADSIHRLGIVLAQQKRYREAQRFLERALSIREVVLGSDHPDTADSIHNLAVVLERQGWYTKAQLLYEQALVVRESVLGTDHSDTMKTMESLAGVQEAQRQYGKALSLYERVFAIRKRVLGLTHPDTQSLQRDVGRVQRLHQNTKKKKRK